MTACSTCHHYKKGKGSKACIKCPEIKDIGLSRAKPCVAYIKIPRELLESLSDEGNVDIYSLLTTHEATLIFQLYHLDLTHMEIAEYYNIDRSSVTKQKKRILDKLKTYLLN